MNIVILKSCPYLFRYLSYCFMLFLIANIFLYSAQAVSLNKDADLSDQEIQNSFNSWENNYKKFCGNLKEDKTDEELASYFSSWSATFSGIDIAQSQMLSGILEILRKKDVGGELCENNSLNHTCDQGYMPSLVVRGLSYLQQYNEKRNIDLLSKALDDLKNVARLYCYWKVLDNYKKLRFNIENLPYLNEFEEGMLSYVKYGTHEVYAHSEKELAENGIYASFLRCSRTNSTVNFKKFSTNKYNDVLACSFLNDPVISKLLKSLIPSFIDDNMGGGWMTLALQAYRETLCELVIISEDTRFDYSDILYAHVSSFFEFQNISEKKNNPAKVDKNFYSHLYKMEKNDQALDTNNKITCNFQRANQELAVIRERNDTIFEPDGSQLVFSAWLVQQLYHQHSIFKLNKYKLSSYEPSNTVNENVGLMAVESGQLIDSSEQLEDSYNRHSLIDHLHCEKHVAFFDPYLQQSSTPSLSEIWHWCKKNPLKLLVGGGIAATTIFLGIRAFSGAQNTENNHTDWSDSGLYTASCTKDSCKIASDTISANCICPANNNSTRDGCVCFKSEVIARNKANGQHREPMDAKTNVIDKSFSEGMGPNITVATYNIAAGRVANLDLNSIANGIKRLNADVVALQEVDVRTRRSGGVDQATELGNLTNMQVVFGKAIDHDGGAYGLAMLSKYKINSHQIVPLFSGHAGEREQRILLKTAINVPEFNEPVVVSTTHLDTGEDPEIRVRQVYDVNYHLSKEQNVQFLLGDMNDIPDSATINGLMKYYRPVDNSSCWSPLTWPSKNPKIKVDYILTGKAQVWDVITCRTPTGPDWHNTSDHTPVVVKLQLREQ